MTLFFPAMVSKKTAIHRKIASKPLRTVIHMGIELGKVLDYGCGRGKDVEVLKSIGYDATGYDPNFAYGKPRGKYDTVLLTYVVNVLEPSQRKDTVRAAWAHVCKSGRLIVTARTARDVNGAAERTNWKVCEDGYTTSTGTFQVGFTHNSLFALLRYCLPEACTYQYETGSGGVMIIVQG